MINRCVKEMSLNGAPYVATVCLIFFNQDSIFFIFFFLSFFATLLILYAHVFSIQVKNFIIRHLLSKKNKVAEKKDIKKNKIYYVSD
jgi:hypothetical protein